MNPVTLPSVRARLVTKPGPIGSDTALNTIGMRVFVARTAAVAGVVDTEINSGFNATSSFAAASARATSPTPPHIDLEVFALLPSECL